MKIKGENKIPVIIAIGVIIVIVLVVKDFKDRDQSTNYSNLTSEEITAAVNNEIETMEPAFEPVEDEKQPTEEDVENALNAFTADEITPVDDAVASIPVIEDEPEFESSQPFETFFNVDKASVNTDETISLVAPDEDDEDDRGKFKGFFKKKK